MDAGAVVAGAAGALAGVAATLAALGGRRDRARPLAEAAPPAEAGIDRAARLLAALPFAAFLVDAGLRVRVLNAAAARLFDVDAGRSVGRALIEVVPSVEVERMVQAAVEGQTRTRDVAFGSGPRERYVGVTAQPYEDGAMAIATDRTEYLARERVRRDFTGNVSHELRTPLTSMKVMLETVTVDDDPEARAIFLPRIAQELQRMIDIVEDLLEIARSESGIVPLRREAFDLAELAAATLRGFAQRAEGGRIALALDAPQPVPVEGDRGRLTQVVVNLLDNALRHTPAGGEVTVRVAREEGDALLTVHDTGPGIPYADLPRIFERFYVVDRSRSREHGGTGLGLAIAKHLVEAHGGTLAAESVYGQGATFTVRLPARVKTR